MGIEQKKPPETNKYFITFQLPQFELKICAALQQSVILLSNSLISTIEYENLCLSEARKCLT